METDEGKREEREIRTGATRSVNGVGGGKERMSGEDGDDRETSMRQDKGREGRTDGGRRQTGMDGGL